MNWLKNNNKRTTKKTSNPCSQQQHVAVSVCADAQFFTHAPYLTFWSCFSGLFEQEGGHVGRAVGENRASSAVFFLPRKRSHAGSGNKTSKGIRKRPFKRGRVSRHPVTVHGTQRSGGRTLRAPAFKNWQFFFGRSRSFFSPHHHFYFWAVRFYCRSLPGPGTNMGTALKWPPRESGFRNGLLIAICVDVQTFKPFSAVASCGGWLICRRVYLVPPNLPLTKKKRKKKQSLFWKCGFCILSVTLNVSSSAKVRGGQCIFFEVRCKVHTKKGTLG